MEAQGRSLLLFNGFRIKGRWWGKSRWSQLAVPAPLWELLNVTREVLLAVQKQLDAATSRLKKAARDQPAGVGALTSQVLEREILDWHRFGHRRQVASLTGLGPGVRASGLKTRNGPITKHGNRRWRTALIELAWRCVRFQPDYPPVRRWQPVLLNPKAVAEPRTRPSWPSADGWPLTCGGSIPDGPPRKNWGSNKQ